MLQVKIWFCQGANAHDPNSLYFMLFIFYAKEGGDKSYFTPIADNNIFIFAFALIHVLMSRHGRNGEVI